MATKTVEVEAINFVTVLASDASFREHFDAVHRALNQTLPEDRYEIIFVEYYERPNPEMVALAQKHPNMQVIALGNRHPGKANDYNIGACVNEALRRARSRS